MQKATDVSVLRVLRTALQEPLQGFLGFLLVLLPCVLLSCIDGSEELESPVEASRPRIGSVDSVAFSPDGQTLASGHWDGMVTLWDVHTGKVQWAKWMSGLFDAGDSVAFSPDGQTLASGSSHVGFARGLVQLWDTQSGKLKRTLFTDGASVAFSPDGEALVSGGLRLWHVATGVLQRTLEDLPGWRGLDKGQVNAIVFSPDGNTIAGGREVWSWTSSGGRANWGHVELWDRQTGTLQWSRTWSAGLKSIAFSPDGQTLVSGGIDRAVSLVDAQTGVVKQTFGRHKDWVVSVAFSPDGQTVASASSREVKLWDAQTGALKRTLTGHSITDAVAFSPDSQMLASGGGASLEEGELWLWDTQTGQLLRQFEASPP
jgi:WD40 repeat protein